ncbi:phosphomannomutase/phosphoglucomutase [Anaerolentibacter hominis]|uniref:phosphomannomutase/phosphoglucomutase n=1 Tax=Anaerolentibacter hominis TaxID=3079009 RepID=UPI0031B885F8
MNKEQWIQNLNSLQNGSDVRGIAMEGIEGEKVNLTPEAANVIAGAFACWLAKKKNVEKKVLRIGIGHDSRLTADSLMEGAMMGLIHQGASVYDCGLVSTPSMFMTTVYTEMQFDGAIMITASHLPFNRNGLKFFDRDGGLEKENIKELLAIAAELAPAGEDMEDVERVDSLSYYCNALCRKIREGVKAEDYNHPLTGLKVVVDAGNGAGGFFVKKVLKPLGADTAGSQFLEPDGMFPNHIPNPENKEAMESIQKAVIDNAADLGIIFDTDVDRMSAVLPDGTAVNRDKIIALMAAIIAKDYPGGTVVTDSVTSDRLTRFIEGKLGMKHLRYKRGYKNVIDKQIELNKNHVVTPLAIETSGHGAMSENYFLDDGAYMAVKLLIAAALAKREGADLASCIADMPDGFEEREYRFRIDGDNYKEYGDRVLAEFEQKARARGLYVVPESYEGIRISFRTEEIRGWLLLRMSLHEPLMPLNMEGEREGDCDRMVGLVRELLEDYEQLTLPF